MIASISTYLGDLGTAVHEYGHHLQYLFRKMDRVFQDHHNRRTAGEAARRLKDIVPGSRYRDDEVAKPDGYYNPYMGKEYHGSGALEMLTMSFQAMLGESDVAFAQFLLRDPETFKLTLGVLFHYRP